MRTVALPILAISFWLCSDHEIAMAGEIRGHVGAVGREATPPARYVVRGQSAASASMGIAGTVAIGLEALDKKATPHVPDTPYVMAQQNTSFVPNLLVVPVGAQVTFPNYDAFFHNVFSYSPPRSFDLGRYPKGETRTVRFEEPGIVRIFCEIHASMYASILVAPSDHMQVIRSQDGFSFPDLPAGRYRVVAVDAAGRRAKTELELERDQTAELTLTLE